MQLLRLLPIAMALIVSVSASAQVAGLTAPVPVPPPVAVVLDKLICKSSIEAGSRIRQHKACFTAKQWHDVDDQHGREARKLLEDGTGKQRGE